MKTKKYKVRRDIIIGRHRFSNYFFGTLVFFGGLIFLLVGIFGSNDSLLPDNRKYIQFWPQGLVICFYGRMAVRLGIYLYLTRFFSVGRGFNEYNNEKKRVRIFRSRILSQYVEFFYSFSELIFLNFETQRRLVESANFDLYLVLKERKKVLLTQLGSEDFRVPKEIERFASKLACFLKIPLEEQL
jgi:hypothetical protein